MSKRATPSRIASRRLRNSRSEAGTLAARSSRKNEMNMRQPVPLVGPSPAPREREGPTPKAWEGEGRFAVRAGAAPLTLPSPHNWGGEGHFLVTSPAAASAAREASQESALSAL